jgi:hypothetical protein
MGLKTTTPNNNNTVQYRSLKEREKKELFGVYDFCIYIYICMCACVCVCMLSNTFIQSMHYTYIKCTTKHTHCMHTHTYTYTHTHTHTHTMHVCTHDIPEHMCEVLCVPAQKNALQSEDRPTAERLSPVLVPCQAVVDPIDIHSLRRGEW